MTIKPKIKAVECRLTRQAHKEREEQVHVRILLSLYLCHIAKRKSKKFKQIHQEFRFNF